MKKSGQWWVGKRVKVYLSTKQIWLHGKVVEYEQSQQLYSIQFMDGQIALHHEKDLFLESKEENRSDIMSTPNFSAFQMKKRKKNILALFEMQFGDSDANMSPRSENSDEAELSDSSKRRRLSLDDNDEQNAFASNGSSENEDIPYNSSDSGSESLMDFSESLDMYEPRGKRAQSVSNSMADFKKMTSQFPRFEPPPSLLTCSGCGQDCAVDNKSFDVIPAQGDRSYIYKCPKCVGGNGKLQHLHKTWTEIALTAKGTSTWWATLHAQITQNRHMFRTVSYGSGYWGIVHGEETSSEASKAQTKHKPRTRIHREESSPKNDESDNEDKIRSPAVPLKGVTCHQCRNRKSVLVSCTEPGCSKRYCEGCLDKHYGMSLTELMERASWKCVNCQGVCSCISCKRGRGEAPPFQGNHKGGRPKNSESPKKRGRKSRPSEDLAATKKKNLVSQLINGDDEDEVPEIESSSDSENIDKFSNEFSVLQTRSGFLPPKELLQGSEIINDIDISDLNEIRLEMLVDTEYEPTMPTFYFNQPQFIL